MTSGLAGRAGVGDELLIAERLQVVVGELSEVGQLKVEWAGGEPDRRRAKVGLGADGASLSGHGAGGRPFRYDNSYADHLLGEPQVAGPVAVFPVSSARLRVLTTAPSFSR